MKIKQLIKSSQPSEIEVVNQYTQLVEQFNQLTQQLMTLNEAVNFDFMEPTAQNSIVTQFGQLIHMFDGAKRGLGLANRLKPSLTKTKQLSRIMGNLNQIRNKIKNVERMIRSEIDNSRPAQMRAQ